VPGAAGAAHAPTCSPDTASANSARSWINGKASAAKAKQAGDKEGQEVASASTPSNPGKPLSEKEDPRLIGKRKINGGFINSISGGVDKEVSLGRQLAAEVDRQAKFIDDPVITEYINRVGQNVVLHSDARIPFTIKVIDSDEVNAFALPGGFFYVNKGLILAADNEAEVAGVMAHEIAHVAARHAMENQAKGMLAEIGLLAGSIFLGGLGGMLINQGAQFGALPGLMKFNRSAESVAARSKLRRIRSARPGTFSRNIAWRWPLEPTTRL
jgi:hypothetical protein